MEQISTKINTRTVSYISESSANPAATIVFIHGFPFNKTIWTEQLKSIPERINGIAYDVRGFGNSSTEHPFFSIDLFAEDLSAFIDKLNLDNCVLCGISMGGYIALRTFELNPKKINGLVLCDTNCTADTNENKIKRFNSIRLIQTGGKNDFTEGFIKNVFSENTLSDKPETVQFIREMIMDTPDETICSTQLALASRVDTISSLQNIHVPTLIIRGENDKLISEEQTRQLLDGIPNSQLVKISESGHLPNLENSEEFNKALTFFLSKHFLS